MDDCTLEQLPKNTGYILFKFEMLFFRLTGVSDFWIFVVEFSLRLCVVKIDVILIVIGIILRAESMTKSYLKM